MKRWSDLDVLERVTHRLDQALDQVQEDNLAAATPCGEWNVHQLLDHVAGGNWFTVAILDGATATDALQRARDAFQGTDGPVHAVRSSAVLQLERFGQPGILGRRCDHVAGDLSGEQVLRLRLHDVAIHTWDLLQAVDPAQGLDPVYVRWAIDELALPGSLTAQHMAVGFDNPSKSYELLLAFGRRRTSRTSHLR